VRFVGEVRGDDKARLLHAADVFALPSVPLRSGRTEGMPTSVLEAMQHGLPVIASDTGGVSDLITHGDNGLLVPAGDPHALAAAIATLRTASTRHKLARRAQRTAADFEWPALGPFFERLLRSGSAF
jgi:glycosyltransferase involved in cell wall biosynthesis